MTKAITFLGVYPRETTYVMPDGKECTAPFFGAALARMYPGLKLHVFVTHEAAEKYQEQFVELVTGQVEEVVPVPIPDGKNEEELWEIFEQVVHTVGEREQVIFDITHGFRSLPFLSFLAAAYLRTVKQIDLAGVLYGNLEAADKTVTPWRAPVIDMTSFVSLLDWMVAADRFMRFGDASDLAERLNRTKPHFASATPQSLRAWKDTGIRDLAETLTHLSHSLLLIRPYDAMEASDALRIKMASPISGVGRLARPFTPLSQQIADSFAPLALDRQRLQHDPYAALAVERTLIDWYLRRNQLVQAAAVAREWLVSYVMLHTLGDQQDLLDRDGRTAIEAALGARIQALRNRKVEADQEPALIVPEQLEPALVMADLLNLYGELGGARNDLMHAAKRHNAQKSAALEKSIRRLCGRLNDLPLSSK